MWSATLDRWYFSPESHLLSMWSPDSTSTTVDLETVSFLFPTTQSMLSLEQRFNFNPNHGLTQAKLYIISIYCSNLNHTLTTVVADHYNILFWVLLSFRVLIVYSAQCIIQYRCSSSVWTTSAFIWIRFAATGTGSACSPPHTSKAACTSPSNKLLTFVQIPSLPSGLKSY